VNVGVACKEKNKLTLEAEKMFCEYSEIGDSKMSILEEHLGYLQCHFELWHACDDDREEDHHRVLFSFFLSHSNNFLKQKSCMT